MSRKTIPCKKTSNSGACGLRRCSRGSKAEATSHGAHGALHVSSQTRPFIARLCTELRIFVHFSTGLGYRDGVKPLRDAEILRRIRLDRVVSVEELARELAVSQATIRRDLHRLERIGALVRVHGGAAVAMGDGAVEGDFPFDDVAAVNRADKEAIAARAVQLIRDGDVVLLDIGTTTVLLARRLRGRRVTVVTSSLAVLDELRDDQAVELILLGGLLRRTYHCLGGSLTEDCLRQVRARWAFLGTSGVAPDAAILDTTMDQVPVKRGMIKAADQVVVLADRHKLPGHGTLRVCEGSAIDHLITNRGANAAIVDACLAHGTEVLLT
ncbi:MAG: DeoR/GlpR transcriptional regulator [Austwickia sp.]|nr:DeoR/GlpR transcriptional regulator [Austwickia sp.]